MLASVMAYVIASDLPAMLWCDWSPATDIRAGDARMQGDLAVTAAIINLLLDLYLLGAALILAASAFHRTWRVAADCPVIDEQMHSLGKAHERAYLEGIRDRLVTETDLRITIAVLDPADADVRGQTIPQLLASYAATTDTDLIVMTLTAAADWRASGLAAWLMRWSAPVPLHSCSYVQMRIPNHWSIQRHFDRS